MVINQNAVEITNDSTKQITVLSSARFVFITKYDRLMDKATVISLKQDEAIKMRDALNDAIQRGC